LAVTNPLNMKAIDIYSPQKMILPGGPNPGNPKKRRINAESVNRVGKEYQVTLNTNESKRLEEFITTTKVSNISVFTLHFTDSNKFIESIRIAYEGNVWSFAIQKENFILSGGACDEI
jgi:ABC-type uncharacterized transport system substrate-binding protein